jgi:hypothetical protein
MTPDEKKASVSTYLSYFQEVINEGIDLGADGDLTPFELIAMTIAVYYHRELLKAVEAEASPATTQEEAPATPPKTIEQLARIYEFPKKPTT